MKGLNILDWSIIILYMGGMIYMSYYLGKKQKNVEDYYLGGNNLSWWAIAISTMATQCSTNSFLGTPAFVALGIGGGFLMLQSELALPLAMIFTMIFLLPFFRRANIISVYEYLEKRFDVKTRTLLSLIFQISRALATGVTVYSASMVFEAALGIDLWLSIIIIGIVTIIYDTFGGMEAVVYSDVIQMGVLYTGVVLCVLFGVYYAGGLEKVLGVYKNDKVVIQKGEIATGVSVDLRNKRPYKTEHGFLYPRVIEGKIYDSLLPKDQKLIARYYTQANSQWHYIDGSLKWEGKTKIEGNRILKIAMKNKLIEVKGLKHRFKTLMVNQFGFKKGEDFSFWAMFIGFLFLYISYYGCDQSQVQRELSTKNIDDTKLSLFLNGILRFFLSLTVCAMGIAIGGCLFSDLARNGDFLIRVLNKPELQNQMVIHFILTYLPHGVIGLLVVAIFSAAMSSLDSAINSLSATTMRDIYERFINNNPSEKSQLRWSKGLTIFWGTFCTASAFLTPYIGKNVVIAINKIGSLTYGPILATFLLAILTKKANGTGTVFGIITGILFNMYLWKYSHISWLWWNVTGCVVTFVVGLLVSYLIGIKLMVVKTAEEKWIISPIVADQPEEKTKGLVWEAGVKDDFGCKLNWKKYYFILVLMTFVMIGICAAIQSIV